MQPGRRIAHYEIEETVGRGGMGVVYRARDTGIGPYGFHFATSNHPDSLVSGRPLIASWTAYFASNRVESSVGSGELSGVTMRGISVQPRMTHSAPFVFRSPIA